MADARPFHWEYTPAPVTREVFRVEGGRPLAGTVRISGAKNAALKLLAAAVLTGERCRLTNVPEIEDVRVMAETLADLGVVVDHPGHGVYEVAAGDVDWLFVPLEAAAKMRASFILFGPLLARFGRVIISNPGGDRIGRRPVNLHVDAMRALGAEIEYRNGYYLAKAPGRLRGGEVTFPFVSVMGTENAMLAATLAEGRTVIRPAAQEPEVDDLVAFLQKMGAAVERTAPDTIVVEGRRRLRGAEHQRDPRPDRGRHLRRGGRRRRRADHPGGRALRVPRLVRRDRGPDGRPGRLRPRHDRGGGDRRPASGAYRAVDVETGPYPGFATDLQSPTSVLMTRCAGTSRLHETIYEDRLEWLGELRKMGAAVAILDAAPRRDQRAGPAARHGGRHQRPAGRRVAHPGRPRGGRDLHDSRRPPRPARL